MNHSKDRVLAVLDLEEFNWAQPTIRVDGQAARVRSLAPGLRYSFRLRQAAGGMAAGRFRQLPVDAEVPPEGGPPPQPGVVLRAEKADPDDGLRFSVAMIDGGILLSSREAVVDLNYRFVPRSPDGLAGPVELAEAEVIHGDRSAFRVRFNPSLPDLRYPFATTFEGRMIAGANGQEGYMTGRVRARWADGVARVDFLPDRPFWACERPIRSEVVALDGAVQLLSSIRPDLARDGQGADSCFANRR